MPITAKTLIISWRTICLSLLLSVAAGLSSVAEPIDRVIEAAVGRLAWRPVSGDIVVVALDDKTMAQASRGDFSAAQHARVIDAVDRARARRLFVDFTYERRQNDRDLPLLTGAVKRMKDRIVLAASAKLTPGDHIALANFPGRAFGADARVATIGWKYEFWQVWRIPLAFDIGGRLIPSFSSELANRPPHSAGVYALDYSYNVDTITTYSASDVMSGKVGARELAGKDVIFAATSATFQDTHYLPGNNRVPGAFIHLIGAETLKRGMPVDIGWLPGFVVASLAMLTAMLFRRARWFTVAAVSTIAALIAVKLILMVSLISLSIGSACFLVAAIGTNVSRTRGRRSAQHENPVSGLPNFEALRSQPPFASATVIAAKVVNFEDLAAFIPGDGIGKLVEQVTRRLQLASQGTILHHDLLGAERSKTDVAVQRAADDRRIACRRRDRVRRQRRVRRLERTAPRRSARGGGKIDPHPHAVDQICAARKGRRRLAALVPLAARRCVDGR